MSTGLAQYLNAEYGDYVDPDGCHWTCAESFIQGYLLGFCCCGSPAITLSLILRHMEEIEVGPRRFDRKGAEDEAQWLVYYLLDKMKFTEHGTCVPGWLTESGKNLLACLREWAAEEAEHVEPS